MTDSDHSEDSRLAEQLGRLVQALAAAGQVTLPGSAEALLSSIVEAAARIFGAAAASILLVNEDEGVLEFKVAHGAANRDLVGTRIPLDQGIAGYVAMTGQPIAISNVEQDARFNRDFAKSTGYVPRSILATPLLAGERVLGVMEVLDKIDAPSFGMQDMELLGLFAHQAALAIDKAQGIAGYVAMTGQPIAISNVEQDTRFNRDFAKSTGYVPRSILATPLLAGERILGVMEVLDKIDAPSFGMQDMELLGLFAHQAALAIDQAQGIEDLGHALLLSLKRLALSDQEQLPAALLAALEAVPDPAVNHDLLELAGLLNEFSQLGEAERRTCLKILAAFIEYGHMRRHPVR